MKKTPLKSRISEMKKEYDFSKGVRGKYADAYSRRPNVALLDPDVAAAFPDSKAVNDALRALVTIAERADTRKRA